MRRSLARLLVLALVLRLAIAAIPGGHLWDQGCFKAWGIQMVRYGAGRFYASSQLVHCDYPPAYLYVVGFWAWLYHLVDPGIVRWGLDQVMAVSPLNAWMKLPASFADVLNGWLVWRILAPRLGEQKARGAAVLYLFNPLFFYDSAWWGQLDTVIVTFSLLVLWASIEGRLVLAMVAGTLGVLIKPQGIFVLPAGLASQWHRKHGAWWWVAIAASALVAWLVIAPFWPGGPPWHPFVALVALMRGTADDYLFASMKAFNLWELLAPGAPDSMRVLGIPLEAWGLAFLAAAQAVVAWALYRRRDDGTVFLGWAVSAGAFFLLATRMHERYFISGIALLALAVPYRPWLRRWYWVLSAISCFDMYCAQDLHFGALMAALGIGRILGLANLVIFGLLLKDLLSPLDAREQPAAPVAAQEPTLGPADRPA